jgi:hypothetical protein
MWFVSAVDNYDLLEQLESFPPQRRLFWAWRVWVRSPQTPIGVFQSVPIGLSAHLHPASAPYSLSNIFGLSRRSWKSGVLAHTVPPWSLEGSGMCVHEVSCLLIHVLFYLNWHSFRSRELVSNSSEAWKN